METPSLTPSYADRNLARENTLNYATMNFVDYFMELGYTRTTANEKVADLSTEVATWIYPYILGNTAPLINAINASTLTFMDAAAKAKITGDLTKAQ